MDTWLKLTLGTAALAALGTLGAAVVKRIAEWAMDWLRSVNDAVTKLANIEQQLTQVLSRLDDYTRLRDQLRVLGFRARWNTSRLDQLAQQLELLRTALAAAGIHVELAPQVDLKMRDGDADLLEVIARLSQRSPESAPEVA